MPDITSVTVTFGHGIKREEYGPVKRAEVSITASVADGEMGEAVLASVSAMALAKVAEMLDAPKPVANGSQEEQPSGEAPARRSRAKKNAEPAAVEEPAGTEQPSESGELKPEEQPQPASVEDEWAAGAADIPITDAEILAATSKRAGELGAREPIVKLIATFATRTEGAPFKVTEIPANQRKDYLDKLAALAA